MEKIQKKLDLTGLKAVADMAMVGNSLKICYGTWTCQMISDFRLMINKM